MSKKKSVSIYSVFIWTLAILFFFYEFFLRVLPATVSSSIIDSLQITIEQFAIIGSGYYLTYAIMQIPVGILLDRFSIRFLITLAAALCSIGALWLGLSDGFLTAFVSRLMIGVGSSFGFVALMVVTLNWFHKKHFAPLLGWGQFLGAVGPIAAGAPIALLLEVFNGNWRLIFIYVALFGLGLTALIGFFLRGKKADPDAIVFIDRKKPLRKQIKEVFDRPQIWWTMGYSAFVYVPLPLLGAFWGVAFLETKGFEKTTASFLISMIWIGLAVGSPVIGKLSEKSKRRIPFFVVWTGFGLASSLLILFGKIENQYYLSPLFFFIGVAGSAQSLSFAVIAENAPKKLRATALGMNNTAIMGMASILPPIVTFIIKSYSKGGQITHSAFEKGLTAIPICFALALIIALFGIKETYCRQQREMHLLKK